MFNAMMLTGCLHRRITHSISVLSRSIVNRAIQRPIPSPRDHITSPQDFLKAIGREAHTKLSIESWDEFWRTSSPQLRKLALPVRDRRYILWCMEKYRLGFSVSDFAHEPPAKKTVRGWGPKVQNGKRLRS